MGALPKSLISDFALKDEGRLESTFEYSRLCTAKVYIITKYIELRNR